MHFQSTSVKKVFRNFAILTVNKLTIVLLKNSRDPIKYLNMLNRQGKVFERLSDFFLLSLMRERDPLFGKLLSEIDNISNPALRSLLRIYGAEYTGTVLRPREIVEAIEILRGQNWKSNNSNSLNFMSVAIKSESFDAIDAVLDFFQTLEKFPVQFRIGVLRLVRKQTPSDYPHWRTRAVLSPLESLQNFENDMEFEEQKQKNHLDFGRALCELVPDKMRLELENKVFPFYIKNQNRCGWLECRINPERRREFLAYISAQLQEEKPLSLIRLGDGESYAWLSELPEKNIQLREVSWWGEVLDQSTRTKISRDMRSAIENANILGTPSFFRFLRDTNLATESYFGNRSVLGLGVVLDALNKLDTSKYFFTEERIHQIAFDIKSIRDIAESAKKVMFVTSIKTELLVERTFPQFEGLELDAIEIPTHSKTLENKMFSSGGEHSLPHIYESISSDIKRKVGPGFLVLIAAGSVGKVFCEAGRQSGAVCLDVGAMADYWIGAKTRTIADIG